MNILITGANSEIAVAIVKSLQSKVNKLILTSRDHDRLKKNYKGFDKNINIIHSEDLSNSNGQESLINFVKDNFNKLDTFIHVAGIYHDQGKAFSGIDYGDFSSSQIRENLEVTTITPALIINSLANRLSTNFKFIALTGTFSTAKGWLPYFFAKKSLEILVTGLSNEYPDYNFNAISPGDTLTQSYKKYFPEYATEEYCIYPKDIANQVKFLLDDDGNYLKGQIIEVRK